MDRGTYHRARGLFGCSLKPLACFGAFDLVGVLDGLGGLDAQECAVLTADRVDTFNEVNNVRCQSSQHSQPSQHCLKPNAPAAGGCSA